MEQKIQVEKRSHLLAAFADMKYSVSSQKKIVYHIANMPYDMKEAEAERILGLMETMKEEEVLKNL